MLSCKFASVTAAVLLAVINICNADDRCTGVNEVYASCKNPCPETCKTRFGGGPRFKCTAPNPCPGGCDCDVGYIRNKANVCIKPAECACGGDPNAEWVECPNPCPLTCVNATTQCSKMCPIPGCQCKDGYAKGSNEKCVLIENCPNICKANEKWNDCSDSSTFDDTCAKIMDGISPACVAPSGMCTPRCECLPGYVRIQNKCVPASNCCGDRNAEVTDCETSPCSETCYSGTPESGCINTCKGEKQCSCKDGLIKDIYGKCIARNKCPVSCKGDPNAIPSPCGDSCPKTCDISPPQTCEEVCIINGCKCKPDYVLNSKGRCILPKDCPTKICGENEVYDECPLNCLFNRTCANYFKNIIITCPARTSVTKTTCNPRCVCQPNHYRNDAGACVLGAQCCADKNADEVACLCPGGTCRNPEFEICGLTCHKGCRCKSGHLKKRNTCVLPSQCTPTGYFLQ